MANKQVNLSLNSDDSTAKVELGSIWNDGATGKSYKYVLIEDMAVAANNVVEYSDATGNEVTKDRAGGASLGRHAAGVAVGTITDAQYGFIQIDGISSVTVPAAGAVAAGDLLVPHATSDGGVAKATTSTFKNAFAVALSADTATTSVAGTCTAKLFRI